MICSITFSPCDPEDVDSLDLKTLKGRSYRLLEGEKSHWGWRAEGSGETCSGQKRAPASEQSIDRLLLFEKQNLLGK